LHVVAHYDTDITRSNGEKIPTLELKIPKGIYEQYLYLMQNKQWVPCETFIKKVDQFTLFQWKEALLIERLNEKSKLIAKRLEQNKQNWEETFYQSLAANFGFKTNSQPFEMLARSLPLQYLAKHKDQPELIEAMLFGQAGLIPENPKDTYTKNLAVNYKHLAHKFELKPMQGFLWKLSKLRPVNFPTIRLSQFAMLIYKSSALLSKILEAPNVEVLANLFEVKTSAYWENHYTFQKTSGSKEKSLGKDSFYNLIINTIAPFIFFYGQTKKNPLFTEKAVNWLNEIPAEKNQIIGHWQSLGLEVKNAADSQALIQLKNLYCNKRNCLNCRIGNQVLKYTY
jgi:hypothetical protein